MFYSRFWSPAVNPVELEILSYQKLGNKKLATGTKLRAKFQATQEFTSQP